MKFFRALIALVCVAIAAGFRANMKMKAETPSFKKFVTAAIAGVLATNTYNLPANALSKADTQSLSYLQVKGTGLANRCSDVSGADTIAITAGKKYKVTDFCLEPTNFQVEEEFAVKKGVTEKQFVNTKLMTRQTYTLEGISGSAEIQDGKFTFTEEDGIDYAATTVQLPGGERVPFLFTVKNLVAKSSSAGPVAPGFDFGGKFTVPSYRVGTFLDPKGRGMTAGYDQAGALPASQTGLDAQEEYEKENNKVFDVLGGNIEFQVTNVNAGESEIGGVFLSKQPGDTDMGGKTPKNLQIKGKFYAKLE
jgi:photosystem II oxygen-evolving enhancer protein 1